MTTLSLLTIITFYLIILVMLVLHNDLRKRAKIHEHNINVLANVIIEHNKRIEKLEESNERADEPERATLD